MKPASLLTSIPETAPFHAHDITAPAGVNAIDAPSQRSQTVTERPNILMKRHARWARRNAH